MARRRMMIMKAVADWFSKYHFYKPTTF